MFVFVFVVAAVLFAVVVTVAVVVVTIPVLSPESLVVVIVFMIPLPEGNTVEVLVGKSNLPTLVIITAALSVQQSPSSGCLQHQLPLVEPMLHCCRSHDPFALSAHFTFRN